MEKIHNKGNEKERTKKRKEKGSKKKKTNLAATECSLPKFINNSDSHVWPQCYKYPGLSVHIFAFRPFFFLSLSF